MIKLLIVCRGNTCRSPMAEYILKDMIEKAGQTTQIQVESAGTHRGSILTSTVHDILSAHDIKHDSKRRARSINDLQLEAFDRIRVMDNGVKRDVLAILEPDIQGRVKLFLDDTDVSDPYGGSRNIYEETYRIIDRGCVSIMTEIGQDD